MRTTKTNGPKTSVANPDQILRAHITPALERLVSLLTDVEEIDRNDATVRMICRVARGRVQECLDALTIGKLPAMEAVDDNDLFEVWAVLHGARSMPVARPAMIAILDVAMRIADAAGDLLADGFDADGMPVFGEFFDSLASAMALPTPHLTGTDEATFMAGYTLAREMLAADTKPDLDDTEVYEIVSAYRMGREQNNLAQQFVMRVVQQPELAEGFSAVLSSVLYGADQAARNNLGREMTYAQMRGEWDGLDLDGTVYDEDARAAYLRGHPEAASTASMPKRASRAKAAAQAVQEVA